MELSGWTGMYIMSAPIRNCGSITILQNRMLPVRVTGMPARTENSEKPKYIWVPGMQHPLFIYKQDIWKLQQTENGLNLLPLCSKCVPVNAEINSAQLWEEKGLMFLGSPTSGLSVVKAPFCVLSGHRPLHNQPRQNMPRSK